MTLREEVAGILGGFGVSAEAYEAGALEVRTPITGEVVAAVRVSHEAAVAAQIERIDSEKLV